MAQVVLEQAILDGLNAAQRAAVTSPADVLQILAPPGSGKTKTLTARVAYLLEYNGFKPWNIIVATFTVKAAREMKERIGHLIGKGSESKLILGTFHSIARRYLVRYGHLIGLKKDFGICDANDSLAIIKRVIKRENLMSDAMATRGRISNLKARAEPLPSPAANGFMPSHNKDFIHVYQEYQDALVRANSLDYDDLLIRCAELLRKHPACVSNIDVVLVDEFQDTNIVQFDLMRLFSQRRSKVCTVGDPDQSIYGWRAAEIKNLGRMAECYPDLHVVLLEENYRSSGAILLSALAVIEQDDARPTKPLTPTHCIGSRPVLRTLLSAACEAEWITIEIERAIKMTGLIALKDVAILLRSAAISRNIENALTQAGMPYKMVGGLRFYDRAEVKIVLDYLRVVCQPDNSEAFARIVNVPPRRIGERTVKGLLDEADKKKLTLFSLVTKIVKGHTTPNTKVATAASKGLANVSGLIRDARKRLSEDERSLVDIVEDILEQLSFQSYLAKTHPEDHEARWANVQELVNQASEYSKIAGQVIAIEESLPEIDGVEQRDSSVGLAETLTQFLTNIALSSEATPTPEEQNGKPRDEVTIATIHSAKGLEWPVVFIPSVADGIIPHSRSEDIDEERRLLYVAMTRAKALLYMSIPLESSRGDDNAISRFLDGDDVKPHLAEQGPSFRFEAVQSISRILGRDCPLEQTLLATSKDLPSREDDMWTKEGAYVGGPSAQWGQSAPKRARYELAGKQAKGNACIIYPASNGRNDGSWMPGTSERVPGFFVSAASHLRSTQEQMGKGGKGPTRQNLQAPRTTVDTYAAKQAAKEAASKPRFTSGYTPVVPAPLKAAIPPSLMRQLPRATELRNNRAETDFKSHASKTYVFLSSSPPPEAVAEYGQKADEDRAPKKTTTPLTDSDHEDTLPSVNDLLKTAEVPEKKNPRRTLGVRRANSKGWPSQNNQAFRVPRPAKRKSDECQ